MDFALIVGAVGLVLFRVRVLGFGHLSGCSLACIPGVRGFLVLSRVVSLFAVAEVEILLTAAVFLFLG